MLNTVGDIPTNILQAILQDFLDTGVTVGRWTIAEDANKDLRMVDRARNGYYRLVKTSAKRTVVTN